MRGASREIFKKNRARSACNESIQRLARGAFEAGPA